MNWLHLTLLRTFYLLCGFGITVGFHRLFTHRSFATVAPVQWTLAILGSMAVQGPLLKWVAQHRKHHQLSDDEGDPHSPHLYGTQWWQMLRGLWHAHTGWLFDPDAPTCPAMSAICRRTASLRIDQPAVRPVGGTGLLLPAASAGCSPGVGPACCWASLGRPGAHLPACTT